MNFKAYEKELPDIYVFIYNADRAMDFDHVIALGHLQEIGRLLVKKILKNEQQECEQEDSLLNLQALMNIEILPKYLVTTLKQLEYLDTRESDMLIDLSQVKKLLFSIHDLTFWYFKTYIDDQFSPPPMLISPQHTTLNIKSNHANHTTELKMDVHIDHEIVKGIWEDRNEGEHYIEFQENESYQGQMSNGMRSGTGVYRWMDGTKYAGQWHRDSEYGFGVKEYANGDCYRGEWKEGLFHGKGTYLWNDGTRFEGNWQDNLEHGYGIKTYTDGSIQKGFWTLGELNFIKDQLGEDTETF